ncbi:hypothetical protein TNCT_268992 [Trichonephila clavata]|uniref:Uncharacterized protein n=1 Tax=Trichonephila clavata TaxID=2740835 RepID=A0A8X6M5F4_TRICU|nr:hypothetical protein TNCT_268992 [Trichonephila clavata]
MWFGLNGRWNVILDERLNPDWSVGLGRGAVTADALLRFRREKRSNLCAERNGVEMATYKKQRLANTRTRCKTKTAWKKEFLKRNANISYFGALVKKFVNSQNQIHFKIKTSYDQSLECKRKEKNPLQ